MSTASVGGIAGRVGDEPWGATLASIANRRLTGQLQLRGDDARLYRIAFVDGAIVAASSPMTVDAVVRIALTNHLVTAGQVAAIQKRVTASPSRDEHEIVIEAGKLSMEHAIKLRRRAIIQRAARTFSIDRGEYRLDPVITLPVIAGLEVDVRTVLALGIRMNLSETRLTTDLRKLGSRFRILPTAELAVYDFGPELAPIVEDLRDGATVPEIDARHREIEPRYVQSMVYALVAGGACEVLEAVPEPESRRAETTNLRRPATIEDIATRTRTTEWHPARQRTEVGAPPAIRPPGPRTVTEDNFFETPRTRTADVPVASRTITPRRLSQRVAPIALSRTFTPTPPQPPRPQERPASRSKPPPVLADEAFHRGVMALRRDDVMEAVLELVKATELAPMDVDYAAMLAWAKFCAAPDKNLIAAETRKVMERAIRKSDKPMTARFYLGRVERILGRVREALLHFKQVLEIEPGHADAAAEIRMLEPRMASDRRR